MLLFILPSTYVDIAMGGVGEHGNFTVSVPAPSSVPPLWLHVPSTWDTSAIEIVPLTRLMEALLRSVARKAAHTERLARVPDLEVLSFGKDGG